MLYVCATPIGNLSDISLRALEILKISDIILCEDTRTSKQLLQAHNIPYKKLLSLHKYNENAVSKEILNYLSEGLVITQISDAGTPNISDPGAILCAAVLDAGYKVIPIPGACAYISLLSISGIMTPHAFYGFLPSNKTARYNQLLSWRKIYNHAICFYESPHRIIACIEDIIECLGSERMLLMGRELTKQFETIKKLPARELLDFIKNDKNQLKGEFSIILYPIE